MAASILPRAEAACKHHHRLIALPSPNRTPFPPRQRGHARTGLRVGPPNGRPLKNYCPPGDFFPHILLGPRAGLGGGRTSLAAAPFCIRTACLARRSGV